jgi:DNA-binding NtrC family response regulator
MKPYRSDLQARFSVLLASGEGQDHTCLQEMLAGTNWNVCNAETCTQALALLRRERPAVLLCDASMPDGNWKDILSHIADAADPPLLVVISKHADGHLWSEVLNLGGYDLLSKPLRKDEVLRTLYLAASPTAAAC